MTVERRELHVAPEGVAVGAENALVCIGVRSVCGNGSAGSLRAIINHANKSTQSKLP